MEISVVMSVYNSRDYLKEAIESILNQTFKEFEFIIIDDGSTDDSIEIIRQYASIDSRIILIENESNIGLAGSLNKGIRRATGKYIARQDADDISVLERLRIQLEFANAHTDIDVIGSNCFVIDINSEVVYEEKSLSSDRDFQKNLLNRSAIFAHGCAFIKREKLIESGLYDERFYYVQDGELWLRLLSYNAKIYVLEDTLYYYRFTPIRNPQKRQAKAKFNEVLQMLYVNYDDSKKVDLKLEEIYQYVETESAELNPFYLSNYWKGLANASFLNSNKKIKSYFYLLKASYEKNSVSNYMKFFALAVMYVFPRSMVGSFIKLLRA